jgi:formyl-CoA transferase
MRAVRGTIPRTGLPAGPLTGTLVLDFGQTAVGPVAAMFLGYLGATVIKVEQPRGELGRYDVSRKHDAGLTFLSTNLGKFGVVLDIKEASDRDYALGLLSRADVLIDNFRNPEVMRRLGLDYFDVLRPVNPGLVYLQASSFQGRGSLKDFPSFEWAAQAISGFAGATGAAGGKPEFSRGTAYLDWSGAMMNTIAVLAGLHHRIASGEGCMLSTSQFGTCLHLGASRLATFDSAPDAPARLGHDFGHDSLDRAFSTADGFISICAPTPSIWRRLSLAVGLSADTPPDPRGGDLEPILKSASTDEWLARFRAWRVPAGAARPGPGLVDALRAEPQVLAEGLVRTHDEPRGGVLYAAPPWAIPGGPDVTPRPAPALGEHDSLIRSLLVPARAPAAAQPVRSAGTWSMSPLEHHRPLAEYHILGIGTGLAVGTAGTVLAELGAGVTKVVPPWGDCAVVAGDVQPEAVGDDPPPTGVGSSPPVPCQRRRTESLDLRSRAGRVRLGELVRRSAAVIVSGPIGFRQKFGLDEPDLRALRTDIVYCGLTGYGARGPLAGMPATEFDIQLIGGMTRQVGVLDALPVRQGFHLTSVNTGYAAAQAVLAGLLTAPHDPSNRHFEVSLLRTAVALNGWNITAASGNDGVDGKQTRADHWPPDHGYSCRDREVLISIRNNDEGWANFLIALGRSDLLADERFSTLEALRTNEWRLAGVLAPDIGSYTSEELKQIVEDCGGQLVPVLEPAEVLSHPQSRAQNLVASGIDAVRLPVDLVSR